MSAVVKKCLYAKILLEKNVRKLIEGYVKFIGGSVKVQKTPGDTGKTLSKSEIEEPRYIYNYRSFLGKLRW